MGIQLGQLNREVLRSQPDKLAVVCGEDALTYGGLEETADLFARSLGGWGITKGDRVALFMPNRTELAAFYFALTRLGAVAIPIPCYYQSYSAAHIVRDSGSRLVIAAGDLLGRLTGLREAAPSVEAVCALEGRPEGKCVAWERLVEAAPVGFSEPAISPNDLAVILYTSGSTARPKGVMHTHGTLGHQIANKCRTLLYDERTVNITGSHLCHVSAFDGVLLPTIHAGGTVLLLGSFAPGPYLRLLARQRATIVWAMPGQILQLLDEPECASTDFSSVLYFTTGGDLVPPRLHDRFRARTGVELKESFGMTECEGFLANPFAGKNKPGSIGVPVHGTKVRLVGSDGRDVPRGEPGEILVRSEAAMKGYWNEPEATEKAFTDGWLRTGDLGRQDEEGYFYFLGRCRNVISRGGGDVSPEEVERVLEQHPGVQRAGVLGLPREMQDSELCALIVVRPGLPRPAEADLAAFAAEGLPARAVPERWLFVGEIPFEDSGKVNRKFLNELAKATLTA